jgi:hypothetical protein
MIDPVRPRRMTPAGLVLLAILGISATAAIPRSASAIAPKGPQDSALTAHPQLPQSAAPIASQSYVFEKGASLQPGLPGAAGTPVDLVSFASLRLHACSGVERRADLVATQILKKYLHFRESLSTP